jgi:hypothetical protein
VAQARRWSVRRAEDVFRDVRGARAWMGRGAWPDGSVGRRRGMGVGRVESCRGGGMLHRGWCGRPHYIYIV